MATVFGALERTKCKMVVNVCVCMRACVLVPREYFCLCMCVHVCVCFTGVFLYYISRFHQVYPIQNAPVLNVYSKG